MGAQEWTKCMRDSSTGWLRGARYCFYLSCMQVRRLHGYLNR